MSDEPLYLEPDPKHFRALVQAAKDGEVQQGEIEALWMEDELWPRMFEVIGSDHPWVRAGDKVYIVAGSERPQG